MAPLSVIITDALTCKPHFNVVAGQGGANINHFTHSWVFIFNIMNHIL